MKKRSLILIVASFLIFALSSSAYSFSLTTEGKAQDLIEKAQKQHNLGYKGDALTSLKEAHQMLKSYVVDHLDDASAIFLLAKCEHNISTLIGSKAYAHGADQRFQIAYQLDKNYGSKIYEFYISQANIQKVLHAKLKLEKNALKYQPSKKSNFVTRWLRAGKNSLSDNNYSQAHVYLENAIQLDQSQAEKASDMCFQAALETPGTKEKFMLWAWSYQFDPKHKRDIVQAAIPILKQLQNKSRAESYASRFPSEVKGKIINAAYPPPSWKTVYTKKYTARGFSGGEYNDGSFQVAAYGKDYDIGDRIVILGENVEAYAGGGFRGNTNGRVIVNIQYGKKGDGVYARAPKGEKIKVKIQSFQ